MKTNVTLSFGFIHSMGSLVFVLIFLGGMFNSCMQEDDEMLSPALKSSFVADYSMEGILDVCFETEVLGQIGKPMNQMLSIGSFNLMDYDDCFVLHVSSESVSSAIVRFNDDILLSTSDFANDEREFSFQICDLTEESVLEVEIRDNPGSLLHVWIEGKMTSFVDARDGKRYKVVQIGDQIWMEENLAWLPEVNLRTEGSDTDPLYYVYGYEGTDVTEAKANDNYSKFEVLYNWPATINAAPDGWHVASDEEWKQMEMFLGMTQEQADGTVGRGTDEGKKLKGTTTWLNDGNGTNSSGFNGLSCGYRSSLGNYFGQGNFNNWWTSTEGTPATLAYTRRLVDNADWVGRMAVPKVFGFNVRCIRD